ncbi:MAG: HAD family hydrolase [Deltaproteobacteria bacterium]|nr:HAD family hydrolase [Deltaproteobacteria bacterium]
MEAGDSRLTIRAVIFDLDGTIADSVELFYGFACEIATDLDLPPPEREAVYELMRTGRSNFTQLLPGDVPQETINAAFAARGPQWLRRYHEDTRPIPGSVEALRTIHKTGLMLGIATSSGRDVPFLQRWGVRSLFAAIVGREDVVQRKPAPEVIIRCLDQMAATPSEVIYVGDSPIDIQAGKAAGVGTVGVLSGTSSRAVLAVERPDAIVQSLIELPDLLATSAWSRRA